MMHLKKSYEKLINYLRYICDHLRWKRIFQKSLERYRLQIYGLLLLFLIALLQSTLLNYFRIFNVKPDAILAALILFVAFFDLRWLAAFAFLGGIFRDIFSALPFGFNTIICILWVILANRISRRLSIENNVIRSCLLCLIILLNNLTMQSILFVLGKPVSLGVFSRIVFIESIFTLFLASLMYRVFVHLFQQSIK
jgi:rod shape-determining protein MreD